MLMETQDIGSWLLAIGSWVKATATTQTTKDTKGVGTGDREQVTAKSTAETTKGTKRLGDRE